ncbi:hypothetical protein E8E14_001193 [Neopestalotiopsis sp. 37M]|nr:hypothetical protein E8E14_001193 [Neopestalotiopsis sp. 37M]
MMTTDTKWNAGRRRVFQSVFRTSISQPTPYSTPSARFPEKGQPFGGPPAREPRNWSGAPSPDLTATSPSPESRMVADQTRYDRSWHDVTSRIALPPSVTVEDSFGPPPDSQDAQDEDFDEALRDVLDPAFRLSQATFTEDILTWHTQQVRLHFVNHVLPLLTVCDGYADQTQVLLGSMRTLEAANRLYHYGLSIIIRSLPRDQAERYLAKFRRDLHALVANSMSEPLMDALRNVLGRLMAIVLGVDNQASETPSNQADDARKQILQLVESLAKIGLTGERFQALFAELLDRIMEAYIIRTFAGRWKSDQEIGTTASADGQIQSRPYCIRELSKWIEKDFARLAVEVTFHLGDVRVAWTEIDSWKSMAIARLANLRISELFDMVINWPHSEGGINDLRYTATTSARRLRLTDVFSSDLEKRLLHPGRSTLDILRTYISMIKAFQKLDQSRVLLDRVASRLQLYLCTREDTVRIIVTSLLTSPKDANEEARKTKLIELVELMHDPSQSRLDRQHDEWDDLSWVPAPVDAGSNYRGRKSEDVIGTLISAVGSPDVFIKEFQSIVAEQLLSERDGFEQEATVLALLKKRFGESALQACDVMLKDVQDSKRLNNVIYRGAMNNTEKAKLEWTTRTKILSRLFWPDMGEERFVVPQSVAVMQQAYEDRFEHLKPSRKLKWLNHLGQATVELEFQDRTISEDVRTYEAAIIDAFAEPPKWAFEDLWMHLQMDEDLLTAGLQFWVDKRVLRKLLGDEYVVIERLDDAEQHMASVAQQSGAKPEGSTDESTASSRKAKPGMSEKEKAQRQVYWQFIVGMLTNSMSQMPLGQISMMMKMLIADGFPWSNEELQEFLGDKVAEGELELTGGKYKLAKK